MWRASDEREPSDLAEEDAELALLLEVTWRWHRPPASCSEQIAISRQ
jgi:hypothetical protein